MYFELSVTIDRPPSDVFAFLRDKDLYPLEPGSAVLVLEKITAGASDPGLTDPGLTDPGLTDPGLTDPGLTGLGARYREVVQMLPFVRGEILSEITRYEPDRFLEEDFWGAGMQGHLAYEFVLQGGGTQLIQRETLQPLGLLRLIGPLIRLALARRLRQRLESIKVDLEGGWQVASSS